MIRLTVQDAYAMISKFPDRIRLLKVIETADVWAFKFSTGDESIIGGAYDAVNKKTGGVHRIAIPYGLYELDGGHELDIRQFQK